jgi:hypothetical protein
MDANQTPNGAEGDLTATAFGTTVSTTNHVVLKGRLPQITLAETQDLNGNGYLDAMVVHFNLPVDLSGIDLGTILASFHVAADEVTLTNWTVVGITGRDSLDGSPLDDSVFVLKLAEAQNGQPQTAWTPTVSVSGLPGVSSGEPATRSVDKAPPAVWVVYKVIDPSGNAAKHTYIVIMSERVEAATGSGWEFAPPNVGELLDVYTLNRTTGQYEPVTSDLLGSAGNLTDGATELYAHHFLNIQTIPSPIVADLSGNEPDADNQKVRVVPLGQVGFDPRPIPNPAAPDAHATPQFAPGVLYAGHESGASDKVKSGEWGGFALVFDISVPDASCSPLIRVFRKIYDVTGNLVNSGVCENLLQTFDDQTQIQGGRTVHIEMHWDAFNSQGKPVAPGVYREILYLDYECPSLQDQRAIVTYGVRAR